ncbi:hypothetical protein ACF0H5_011863 [Mactra antiquata]
MEAIQNQSHSLEEIVYEKIGFGLERDTNSVVEEEEEEPKNVPGIKRITSDGNCDVLSSSTICLTFLSQLKVLREIKVQSCSQKDCPKPVELTEDFVGSAVYLKWVTVETMLGVTARNIVHIV